MTKMLRTALLGALAAAALPGCSNSSSDSRPADALAFCQSLTSLEESRMTSCQERGLPPFLLPMLLDCRGFEAAQDAERIAYDKDQAAACLDSLQSMSCAELQTIQNDGPNLLGLPAACQAAVAGQVASDGACYSMIGYECASGYCDFGGDVNACFAGGTCKDLTPPAGDCSSVPCQVGYTCDGTQHCVASTPVAILGEGGDCSVPSTICDDPYYCASGTCTARKTAGTLCGSQSECQLGLLCPRPSPAVKAPAVMTDAGTCIVPLKAGATCFGADCAEGLYCADDGVCAANPTVGQSCTIPGSGDYVWCTDSWCDNSGETPTCQPFRQPGDPCSTSSEEEYFLSCGPGYLCIPSTFDSNYGTCGRLYCPFF
jgi:hypothetical protein